MPKSKTTRLAGGTKDYEELIDARSPLVVARAFNESEKSCWLNIRTPSPQSISCCAICVRRQPVRWKPILLLGPTGSDKSRLVRRIRDLLVLSVYRIDGSGSTEAVNFAGTSKAWNNTVPCAPARAIYQARIGNPIVMVDEADKAGTSQHNGRLANAILPFLERETASRYRDASPDSELDLSWVNHIATANAAEDLPGALKDRYRAIKVPYPRLVDLPVLAANVVRELAAETGEVAFAQALVTDELNVIARAWTRAGFSMRKLQAIVAATLEARDQMAVRH
ncbi:ATP-dependent Lon protease [Bradyrhizobium sp. RT9b]|uniref:AAA family ATPase n=1 Tax=unclassified Bradyrhizobium TaxID=2631580 RepID=UPI0033919747